MVGTVFLEQPGVFYWRNDLMIMRNHSNSWVAPTWDLNCNHYLWQLNCLYPWWTDEQMLITHCVYVSMKKRYSCVSNRYRQTEGGLWAQFTAKVMKKVENESKQSSLFWAHSCHMCSPWYPQMYTHTVSLYLCLFIIRSFFFLDSSPKYQRWLSPLLTP